MCVQVSLPRKRVSDLSVQKRCREALELMKSAWQRSDSLHRGRSEREPWCWRPVHHYSEPRIKQDRMGSQLTSEPTLYVGTSRLCELSGPETILNMGLYDIYLPVMRPDFVYTCLAQIFKELRLRLWLLQVEVCYRIVLFYNLPLYKVYGHILYMPILYKGVQTASWALAKENFSYVYTIGISWLL